MNSFSITILIFSTIGLNLIERCTSFPAPSFRNKDSDMLTKMRLNFPFPSLLLNDTATTVTTPPPTTATTPKPAETTTEKDEPILVAVIPWYPNFYNLNDNDHQPQYVESYPLEDYRLQAPDVESSEQSFLVPNFDPNAQDDYRLYATNIQEPIQEYQAAGQRILVPHFMTQNVDVTKNRPSQTEVEQVLQKIIRLVNDFNNSHSRAELKLETSKPNASTSDLRTELKLQTNQPANSFGDDTKQDNVRGEDEYDPETSFTVSQIIEELNAKNITDAKMYLFELWQVIRRINDYEDPCLHREQIPLPSQPFYNYVCGGLYLASLTTGTPNDNSEKFKTIAQTSSTLPPYEDLTNQTDEEPMVRDLRMDGEPMVQNMSKIDENILMISEIASTTKNYSEELITTPQNPEAAQIMAESANKLRQDAVQFPVEPFISDLATESSAGSQHSAVKLTAGSQNISKIDE